MAEALKTEADILKAIAKIKKYDRERDGEAAHGFEDDLHQSVLQAIASGTCTDPQGWARLALTTLDLKFNRWMA